MITRLVFESLEQFEDLLENKDYDLATSFVDSMISNITSDEELIPVIEAYFEEEDTIYDFEVEKTNFIPNLKEFITIYEREEDYEGCLVISNAIKTLEGLA